LLLGATWFCSELISEEYDLYLSLPLSLPLLALSFSEYLGVPAARLLFYLVLNSSSSTSFFWRFNLACYFSFLALEWDSAMVGVFDLSRKDSYA